jgi:hypothetical protein
VYKLVPTNEVPLKTYWCSDLHVAEKVASEIRGRFECDCEIVDVPNKQTWAPEDLLETVPRCVRAFQLQDNLNFGCFQEQLDDALNHAIGDILKIKDRQEIFCFQANDPFWQRVHDTAL